MSKSFILLAAFAAFMAAGCASSDFLSDDQARTAVNVPDHFLVVEPDGSRTEPGPGQGCRNPMVDPRDGTQVTLVRSQGDRGDYQAPAGRYGTAERELLRIECSTGRVVGVVKR